MPVTTRSPSTSELVKTESTPTAGETSRKDSPGDKPGWVPYAQGLTALVMILALAAVLHPDFETQAVLRVLRDLGPWWFYGGLVILPLAFVPTSPFYFLAGAAFPMWVNLVGVSVALLLNLTLAYWVGHFFLRSFSLRMAEKFFGKKLQIRKERQWAFALLIKMAPGVSPTLKSYVMSAVGIPFGIYIIVSWVITMFYAVGLIFFGASFEQGNRPVMIALGLIFVATVIFFTWYVRRYLKAEGVRRRQDDPEET